MYFKKKDSLRRKLQEQIFIDLHEARKVKQRLRLDFKRTKTRQTHEGAIRLLWLRDLCNNVSDRRNFNFWYVVSCKISSFANELNLFFFPKRLYTCNCLNGDKIGIIHFLESLPCETIGHALQNRDEIKLSSELQLNRKFAQ